MEDRLVVCVGMGCVRCRFRLSFAFQKRLAMAMESAIESGFSCTLGLVNSGVVGLSVGFGSASRGLGNGRSVVCTVFRSFFCSCARAFVQHSKTQINKQICFIIGDV